MPLCPTDVSTMAFTSMSPRGASGEPSSPAIEMGAVNDTAVVALEVMAWVVDWMASSLTSSSRWGAAQATNARARDDSAMVLKRMVCSFSRYLEQPACHPGSARDRRLSPGCDLSRDSYRRRA